jgi:hypothetical protein
MVINQTAVVMTRHYKAAATFKIDDAEIRKERPE